MSKAQKLRAEIEQIEQRAARLAVELAASLLQPTRVRDSVTYPLTILRDRYRHVADLTTQMRSAIGGSGAVFTRRSRENGTDERFVRMTRARLKLWDKVLAAADYIDAGHEWPPVPPPRDRFDLGAPEETIMSRVFTRAHGALNASPQAGASVELGCFPDIPLNSSLFLANAHLAYRVLLAMRKERPYRFVDVGCGGGVKVILAAEFFDRTTGLEYDPGYVATAQRTLEAFAANRSDVVEGDGVTYPDYGAFDVIYFYMPMSVAEGLHAMERQIAATARPGTVLIAPYAGFLHRSEMLGCAHVFERVFVVGLDEADVPDLRAEVTRIGPHIVDPDNRIPANAGWLRPLWAACQANGIDPG